MVRFTSVVGVRVEVVNERALGCAGGVAASELCVDDITVELCATGFKCGSLRFMGMAGAGASRRPPASMPPAISRCAVCGTGFRTRSWARSCVVVERVVVRG
jgi:hypothetical protein